MTRGIDFQTVKAIARKDLAQYLGNPTGYVFLTLFIATTAAAAFLLEGFFSRNLADLAELNRFMPAILVFFVPAITMSAWADERRGGTDELLLTLPVRDGEVMLGKYLGVLGMFTASLAFSLAHWGVLAYLGDPDSGLMLATYLGYWLVGALFCGVGIVASILSQNATVGFILGALGCAGLVLTGTAPWASGVFGVAIFGLAAALIYWVWRLDVQRAGLAGIVGAAVGVVLWRMSATAAGEGGTAWFEDAFAVCSVVERFSSFGEGVIRVGDVLYFVGGTAALLYFASVLIGRRHWV